MDEYLIVPKRIMDQKLTQIQLNREPPEALEVLNLDELTTKILRRKDLSDYAKADMLASTLERFLALRPKAFGESNPLQPVAQPPMAPEHQPTRELVKSTPHKRKRQASPMPMGPSESFFTPGPDNREEITGKYTAVKARGKKVNPPVTAYKSPEIKQRLRRSKDDVLKSQQEGSGLKKWIFVY